MISTCHGRHGTLTAAAAPLPTRGISSGACEANRPLTLALTPLQRFLPFVVCATVRAAAAAAAAAALHRDFVGFPPLGCFQHEQPAFASAPLSPQEPVFCVVVVLGTCLFDFTLLGVRFWAAGRWHVFENSMKMPQIQHVRYFPVLESWV